MNKVGSESLNLTVAKAAENIIDTKGVSGKPPALGKDWGSVRSKCWAVRLHSFLLPAEDLLRSDSGSPRDSVLSSGKGRTQAWEGTRASPAPAQAFGFSHVMQ